MKKVFTPLLLMLAIMVGCTHQGAPSQEAVGVVFDSAVVNTMVRLRADAEMPSGQLSLHIAYAKPQADDTASVAAAWRINRTLLSSDLLMSDYTTGLRPALTKGHTPKTYVEKALRFTASNYRRMYLADYAALFKEDPSDAPAYNRAYTVTTHVMQGTDSIVNYVADTYYYDGGAHGQAATWARNFNKHTGATVTLADILRPGYGAPLTRMIVADLVRQFKANTLQQLQDDFTVFMGMTPYIPDNYIIDSKGITFIYCQDEVAAHAVGELRVTLNYKQMTALLRKK